MTQITGFLTTGRVWLREGKQLVLRHHMLGELDKHHKTPTHPYKHYPPTHIHLHIHNSAWEKRKEKEMKTGTGSRSHDQQGHMTHYAGGHVT